MSRLDEIERAATPGNCAYCTFPHVNLTALNEIANPATVLAMVEVIRAAREMRKAGTDGVWSKGKRLPTEEAAAFDAALAKLEDSKQ